MSTIEGITQYNEIKWFFNKSFNKVSTIALQILNFVAPKNPVSLSRQVRIIPRCLEKLLGSIYFKELCPLRQTITRYDDDPHDYRTTVKEIGTKLVDKCDVSDLDFKFRVIRDDRANAFCLPGGKIAITTSLLNRIYNLSITPECNSKFEDLVAAVLAHEITHACASHSVTRSELCILLLIIGKICKFVVQLFINQKMQENVYKKNYETIEEKNYAIKKANKNANFINEIVNVIFESFWSMTRSLITSWLSRQDEYQADCNALRYMKKVNYNPRAMVDLQNMFAEIEDEHKIFTKYSFMDKVASWLASHPRSEDRAKVSEYYCNKIEKPTHDLDNDFDLRKGVYKQALIVKK